MRLAGLSVGWLRLRAAEYPSSLPPIDQASKVYTSESIKFFQYQPVFLLLWTVHGFLYNMVFQWQRKDVEVAEDNDDRPLQDDVPNISVGKRPSKTQKCTTGSKRKSADKKKRPASMPHSEDSSKKQKVMTDENIKKIEKSKNIMIIVGIDHGTTYSGEFRRPLMIYSTD